MPYLIGLLTVVPLRGLGFLWRAAVLAFLDRFDVIGHPFFCLGGDIWRNFKDWSRICHMGVKAVYLFEQFRKRFLVDFRECA